MTMRNLKKDLLFAFSLVLISNSIPLYAQSNSSNVTNNTAPVQAQQLQVERV